MANIHNGKDRLARIALARFGKQIFVNGIKYTAIIADDDFEDDAGFKRDITASFHFKERQFLKKGDKCVYEGMSFELGTIPRHNTLDNLFEVELKRA